MIWVCNATLRDPVSTAVTMTSLLVRINPAQRRQCTKGIDGRAGKATMPTSGWALSTLGAGERGTYETRTLTGWGRTAPSTARVLVASSVEQIAEAVRTAGERGVIP